MYNRDSSTPPYPKRSRLWQCTQPGNRCLGDSAKRSPALAKTCDCSTHQMLLIVSGTLPEKVVSWSVLYRGELSRFFFQGSLGQFFHWQCGNCPKDAWKKSREVPLQNTLQEKSFFQTEYQRVLTASDEWNSRKFSQALWKGSRQSCLAGCTCKGATSFNELFWSPGGGGGGGRRKGSGRGFGVQGMGCPLPCLDP